MYSKRRKTKSDTPVHLNLAQALSKGTISGTREDANLGKTDSFSINPSAPSLLNINTDDDDVNRDSYPDGSLSMFQSLLGVGPNRLSGRKIKISKASNFMVKGNWGQVTYNANSEVEYKRIPRTDENTQDDRTPIGQERDSSEEEIKGSAYSEVSGLLSKIKHEDDNNERTFMHESIRRNANNVQRRNLFQFSPLTYNGTDISPPSQGTLGPCSDTKIYPQGIDTSFINARAFNIRTYEQFCRIISGANRKPFEGEMHGGIIYKVSDYLIIRERFLRESYRLIFEDRSEEVFNASNCCSCTISRFFQQTCGS